jgi:predicted HicB family RNase H-like nuclease
MTFKTSYIYIRLKPELKAQLKAEAALSEVSLQQYVVAIIRYRKRVKVALPVEGDRYLGY